MIIAPSRNLREESTGLKKYERIEKLIKILVELPDRFTDSNEAHEHIYQCLCIVERQYVDKKEPRMDMYGLEGFNYCDRKKIFFTGFFCHVVVINENGAFAIYKSSTAINDGDDFTVEIRNNHCILLVEQPSHSGEQVWN